MGTMLNSFKRGLKHFVKIVFWIIGFLAVAAIAVSILGIVLRDKIFKKRGKEINVNISNPDSEKNNKDVTTIRDAIDKLKEHVGERPEL